ncbi:hypothetical protein [Hirschia baltica]|uniref:Uncharacterized protein n=1 Tax=Hirschia baltica (strain ATCC 49814 / DSM 5838 / IFAM 1418) TaxID=582402 RepID=C6XR29_HIRBI|nr:hypothetical protein [Hirschia baltica]ACT60560.1 hypothetical protein Hbal_2889 [Hirschia baltica ATCC 49814]
MNTHAYFSQFITLHMQETGLSKVSTVKAMGYSNIAKGLRRLDALLQNDLSLAIALKSEIATAFSISETEVQDAIRESIRLKTQTDWQEYVEHFKPHAIVKTEYNRPQQITIAGLVGASKFKTISLVEQSSPITFVVQVLKVLPEGVPTFGRTVGFYINYAPERCVEFNILGEPVAMDDEAIQVEQVTIKV